MRICADTLENIENYPSLLKVLLLVTKFEFANTTLKQATIHALEESDVPTKEESTDEQIQIQGHDDCFLRYSRDNLHQLGV